MEFEEVLKRRAMIRAFTSDPVDDATVSKLLRNAIHAPSAGHLQPWEFIVVRDPKVKLKLAEAALEQTFVAEAPVVIVVCANLPRTASRYGQRGINRYSIIDTAYASLVILLSVVNEGLAACFVGAFEDDKVSKVLGLPTEIRPIGIIPIGKAAEKGYRLSRIPLSKLVHYEHW